MTHERMKDKIYGITKLNTRRITMYQECIAKDFPCIRILQNGNIIPQSHKLLDRLYHVPLKNSNTACKKRIKHKYRKHDERRQQKHIQALPVFVPPDSNYFLHSKSFGACPATTAGVGKTLTSLHFMKGLPPNSSFALRSLPASYLHTVHSAKTRSAIPQQPHSHFCPKFL